MVHAPAAFVVRTAAPAQTRALAERLAQVVEAGDLLVLAGEMGAGKTAFAQGFARGLGIDEPVTSPTFTIVREYGGGRLDLHHLDVYRLEQLREVPELGIREMLDEQAVMLVEWGDAVLPVLGDRYLQLTFRFGDGDDDRIIEVRLQGRTWKARTEMIGRAVAEWVGEGPTC